MTNSQFTNQNSKSQSEHLKGIIYVAIAAILWSTGGVFIKLISLNSFQLSFLRSLFAAITILFFFKRDALRFNGWTLINALFYSAILILFVMAAKTTTVANAIFLQYTAPIYVFIFEPVFLKTRFEKANLITIILALFGMVLFFAGDLKVGDLEGNVYAILSGIAFAVFLIGMKKNKVKYQFSTIFYGNVFISLFCSYSIWGIDNIVVTDIIMVGYLGIFQIGLAYIVFSYGLKRIQAVEASLIGMIEPILNPIWTYFGYGEVPSVYSIFGGVVILLSLLLRYTLPKSVENIFAKFSRVKG